MRKVWSTLVILAILVGMLVCLGAQASAEEGPKDLAVVAVANETLTAEHIDRIKESMPEADVLVIDVNGVDGDGAGYSYGYSDMDQGFAPDNYSFIWPGMASVPTMEVTDEGENHCKVVLLPIGPNDTAETINAAVDGYKAEGENVVVIAIAPESCYNVQAAVDSNVDQVLTCGETDAVGDKLIKVGEDETNPVCLVKVDEFGLAGTENMPLPEAADPGVGTQGTMTLEEPGPAEIASDPATYTVTFAGGEGATGKMEAVTVNAGATYELPQYCDFAHDGYTFIGWKINDTEYKVFDPVEWTYTTQAVQVTGDITATAMWQEQAKEYSVSYMPGTADGVEVTGSMPPASMTGGTSYALLANGFAAEGYEFKGWDIGGEVKQPDETVTVNEDITATATWEKSSAPVEPTVSDKYTITFKAGVEGVNDITTPDKVVGDTIILADLTTDDFFSAGGALPPEGKTFKGWKQTDGEGMSDELKPADTEVTVTGAMEFTAQWDDAAAEPTDTPSPELTVSYKYGEQTITDEIKYQPNGVATLWVFAETGFTSAAPEGQKFKAWKLGETEYAEAAEYTLDTESVTFEAVFEPLPAESFTVTFDANGGTGSVAAMQAEPNGVITLPGGSALTAPANKGFAGWKIGEQTYQANAQYTVTADVTAYAQWNDLQSAGHVDTLKWTQGGTDALVVTYAAPISTITMDGVLLTAGSHYQLSNNNMTAQFYNDYLNSLAAGNHTVVFSFGAAAQGDVAPAATYANETVTLSIAAAAQQPATNALAYTWADRNQPLEITLANETPVALQIDYGSNGGYKTPQGNTNYTVSGNTLTLQPDLVNKNNGGAWPAGRYGFRVVTSSGNNPNLQVTLTSNTVNNTNTNNTAGGTSPVTGDTNNVVLYVVLLAVLVVALVVVLVVLVKRRNSGRR